MKFIKYITALLLPALLATGCIMNDGEGLDCERTRVHFNYFGDHPELNCRFLEKADNVEVFIYEEKSGKLVSRISRSKSELVKDDKMIKLNLLDGKYHVVGWANVGTNSVVSGNADAVSATIGCKDGENPTTNDKLYFGFRTIDVVQSTFRDEKVEVKSSHIPIRLYVAGYTENSRAGGAVTAKINNLDSKLDLFSGQATGEKATYAPVFAYDNASREYIAEMQALRFKKDNDIEIQLFDGDGAEIKTVALSEYLNEYDIALSDETEIAIRFTVTPIGVTVEPWEEHNIDPGLQ